VSIKVRKISLKRVYNDPVVHNRLRFLTNGGWGRDHSLMYESLYSGKIEHVWVAEDNSRTIVGWFCIIKNSPQNRIGSVYVERKMRRRGIGKMLVSAGSKYRNLRGEEVTVYPWDTAGDRVYDASRFVIV